MSNQARPVQCERGHEYIWYTDQDGICECGWWTWRPNDKESSLWFYQAPDAEQKLCEAFRGLRNERDEWRQRFFLSQERYYELVEQAKVDRQAATDALTTAERQRNEAQQAADNGWANVNRINHELAMVMRALNEADLRLAKVDECIDTVSPFPKRIEALAARIESDEAQIASQQNSILAFESTVDQITQENFALRDRAEKAERELAESRNYIIEQGRKRSQLESDLEHFRGVATVQKQRAEEWERLTVQFEIKAKNAEQDRESLKRLSDDQARRIKECQGEWAKSIEVARMAQDALKKASKMLMALNSGGDESLGCLQRIIHRVMDPETRPYVSLGERQDAVKPWIDANLSARFTLDAIADAITAMGESNAKS